MVHQPFGGSSGPSNGAYLASGNWAASANGQNVLPQQQPPPPQQQQQPMPPNVPPQYGDPTSLLSMYPIGIYTPVARVASHYSPHTETLQPLSSASDLYPQYASAFQTLSTPQNVQDMQMRGNMATRLVQNLNAPTFSSYGNLPYASQQLALEQAQRYSSSYLPTQQQLHQSQQQSPAQAAQQQPPLSRLPQQSPQLQQSSPGTNATFNYSYPQQPQQQQQQQQPQQLYPLQSLGQQQSPQQRSPAQYTPTSKSLPPAFKQSASPQLSTQYQTAPTGSISSPTPSLTQYPLVSPSLTHQSVPTAYRPGSQVQAQPPPGQYRQQTQSQSPQVQYLSPPTQHRQASPAQPQALQTQTLQSQGYRQPSPLQMQSSPYQLPSSTSQASPAQYLPSVPNQSMYQTAQASSSASSGNQFTLPSSTQHTASPVSQNLFPQFQLPPVQQSQPAGTTNYTSPPLPQLPATQAQQLPRQNYAQAPLQAQSQAQSQRQPSNRYLPTQQFSSQTNHQQFAPQQPPRPPSQTPQQPQQQQQQQQPQTNLQTQFLPNQFTQASSLPFPPQPTETVPSKVQSPTQQMVPPQPQPQHQLPRPPMQSPSSHQQYPQQLFGSAQPLPYALLSAKPQAIANQPPTPVSLTGSPAPSITNEYFENYINRTLKINSPSPTPFSNQAQAPQVSNQNAPQTAPNIVPPIVPPHGRTPAAMPSTARKPQPPKMHVDASPDPRALGPSPAKKRKSNSSSRQSPDPSTVPKQPSFVVELNTLTPQQRGSYQSFTNVSDPHRSTMSIQSTPQVKDEESDDDLDWGDARDDGDWEMRGSSSSKFLSPEDIDLVSVTPTSGRTGDKDHRTSFQKLQTLLEDIFEESDSFNAQPSIDEVTSSRFFDRLSHDGVQPILSVSTIEKLIRYVTRLQDNKKRQRSKSNVEQVPWDVDGLLRLFRMLDKSMRDAESANPFPSNGRKAVAQAGPSPRKKKAGKKTADDAAEATPELEASPHEIEAGEDALATMKAGAAAAFCCLTILDCSSMPKQLYSEDLLSLAVNTTRDQMTKVIFPVVQGLAGEKLSSNYLSHVVSAEAAASAKAKSSRKLTLFDNDSLASLAQSTCGAVPHIAKLIARSDVSFSEHLVIQTVYLAVGPIFVKEPPLRRGRAKADGAGGPTWSVMKSLRTDALSCLRGAFAKYEDQRPWIIEEILGSLGKNQDQSSGHATFQLSDGRSISTLTALLLQLIQASSHGVGKRIRRLRSTRMDIDGVDSGLQPVDQQGLAEEENRLLTEANNSALKATQIIASFLIQKASGNRGSKAQQDTDFKTILDSLVNDLLQVLYRPEWPAAADFVAFLSKILMAHLDDSKTTAEANAAKNVALDYLGEIAARLRSLQLEMEGQPIIPSLDELIAEPSVDGLNKLLEAQTSVQGFLTTAARDDSMYQSSSEMTRAIWAREIQSAVPKAASVLERLGQEIEENEVREREALQAMTKSIRKVAWDVWSATGGSFEVSASKTPEDATQASYAIARARPLQKAFSPILHSLICAMDLPGVAMRSKALRGLAGIVVADPNILSQNDVRNAIEDRLSDSSPQVRDAAVDLIGKYVVQRSEWADQYFPLIAARISDQGLSVRKRVVKLLRDMCASNSGMETRVKICVTLIQAAQDEDDSIKDLALKSLAEIMYPSTFVPDETAALLVDILDQFKGSDEQLERALGGISKLCIEAGHKDRFANTIDSLINRMIDATEEKAFDAKSYIRAIFLLSLDSPALIDTSKASVLLTYLRQPPTNNAEIASNELLLQIFTRSIPFLPKAASTFANDLSNVVRVMIGKPLNADFLPYPIACYTTVVKHITGDYYKLLHLLRTVVDKLPVAGPAHAPVLHYIAALFAEHANLEVAVQKDKVWQDLLNKMTKGRPLAEFLFDRFLVFSSKQPKSQTIPIRCMGALFRANPQLILNGKAEQWMSTIASSNNDDNKASMLDLLRDFLKSEAKRRAKGGSAKDVADLIGSANELHESGISTAVVQRHIEFIMESAKSHHQALQTAAMDVLEFTINQGLYHPLHLVPLLISLETNQDRRMARSALSLHATLHSKHASMLNCRYLEFARASYDYQRTITSEVSGQRNGVALLGGWWELVSEKRNVRLEFLKNVVRGFDFELLGREEINPAFVLYLAENLAVLEYQHQEEVMLVVQHLSRLISEGGAAVANAIELGVVDGFGTEPIEGKTSTVSESEKFSAVRVANASIIIALALLTKNLLLDMYNLTEDKCLNYVSGKKSAVGERTVTRRYPDPLPLDYSRLPLVRGVENVDDYNSQRDTFLQLMKEDGSMGWAM